MKLNEVKKENRNLQSEIENLTTWETQTSSYLSRVEIDGGGVRFLI